MPGTTLARVRRYTRVLWSVHHTLPLRGLETICGRPLTSDAVEPFHVTGQPASTLPVGMHSDGIPNVVQLVAVMEREDLLLRLVPELERALPWRDRLSEARELAV